MASRKEVAGILRGAALLLSAADWERVTVPDLRRDPKLLEELFELIEIAYRPIGGHFKIRTPMDLLGGEVTIFDVADIDEDPDPDAVNLVDTKPAGEKYVGLGHDGTAPAKKAATDRFARQTTRSGVFAEVSDALGHLLLTRYNVPIVEDEAAVRRALKKDIEWVGPHPDGKYPGVNGWYYRDIAGHRHLKLLVGHPR